MSRTPEGRLTARILSELKIRGGFWVKIHGSAFQISGLPDIIGCYRGRFVGLEIKLPETESDESPRQSVMRERITNAGGISRVVTSAMDAVEVTDLIDSVITANRMLQEEDI